MSVRTYPILEEVVKHFPNWSHMYITATTGGTHATNSYHYRGEAIDVGSGSQVYKDQLAAWLYPHYVNITELLHTKSGDSGGWYIKNYRKVAHGYYGKTLDLQHENHVHLAVATTAHANALLASVRGTNLHPTLTIGATGAAVKLAQTLLNKHGAKLSVDGSFGNSTYRAVAAFQKANGLQSDGHLGPLTWVKLLK